MPGYSQLKILVVVILLFFICTQKKVYSEDILQSERLRLTGDLSFAGIYRDNIYLENENEQNDFILRVVPAVSLSAALSENTYLTTDYRLQLDYHSQVENFREDHHAGNIYLEYSSPKKSWIKVGAKAENGAKEPYSQNDESKDYHLYAIYSEVEWNFNSMTVLEGGYEHALRRFNETQYEDDDFIKDFFRFSSLFDRSKNLPLFVEYQFEKQRNNHLEPSASELISHAVLTGFRWGRERRLSGTVSIGYIWSEFNEMDAFDDWTTDTDLIYRLGGFTELKIEAQRSIRVSASFARDVLDYYLLSSIGASVTHSRFEPLQLALEIGYQNREYFLVTSNKSGRMDNLYRIAVLSEYQLKNWMTVSLNYSRSFNQSDRDIYDYTDNLFLLEITLSI